MTAGMELLVQYPEGALYTGAWPERHGPTPAEGGR